MTLHRLLRQHPGNSTRFRHHRGNRLPHDLVVVDETSMVSLTMMARAARGRAPRGAAGARGRPRPALLGRRGRRAHRPGPRLRAPRRTTRSPRCTTTHRYGEEIRALAEALRLGDADAAIAALRRRARAVEWVTERRPAPGDPRDGRCPTPSPYATRPSPATPARALGGARPAPAAVRAPRRPLRRAPLEPAHRAVADPGDRRRRSTTRPTSGVRCW